MPKEKNFNEDQSRFPAPFDYKTVTSKNDVGDPLVMKYYKGGTYNSATGAYTGGVHVFTAYYRYDAEGDFLSERIE